MIRLYPEQLNAQLQEGLRQSYLLWGNEPLLLQESQDAIQSMAKAQGFDEHYQFTLDNHTDWNEIYSLCHSLSLFSQRQSLLLHLPESGPNAAMAEKLTRLSKELHQDLLLIIRGNKLTKAQENSEWFKSLVQHGTFVSCLTPEFDKLPHWVARRAKQKNIALDEQANHLLCYCYEGNLLALSQAIERLSLLYPDGKLTLPRVESAVNDASHFTPYHWVDALLAGKTQRAWHILQQLKREDIEPVILLRTLQRELMQLITLYRESKTAALKTIFDKHRIWQNRRPIFTAALQRLSEHQLLSALQLLAHIEITIKQEYGQTVWPDLNALSLLLCGKELPEGLINYV
ncbi:DNA polymerase III subunit delta [Proteus myxofaciens]|uniref:DNA polymerase III subunit delta n=1 Tax=Proteus myxofaciens ATCC 19692 TaxID=1354337 RepID=A0A198FHT8_9GAMM|nr:DNA polymerase III subunit delta [Proteus myxofaciens]OAT24335.1 DNA polymerase III delta subunit [Proteus myxofaciens ATCC 19692]